MEMSGPPPVVSRLESAKSQGGNDALISSWIEKSKEEQKKLSGNWLINAIDQIYIVIIHFLQKK